MFTRCCAYSRRLFPQIKSDPRFVKFPLRFGACHRRFCPRKIPIPYFCLDPDPSEAPAAVEEYDTSMASLGQSVLKQNGYAWLFSNRALL